MPVILAVIAVFLNGFAESMCCFMRYILGGFSLLVKLLFKI